MRDLTKAEMKLFLKNQQGELDTVLMYQKLAALAATDREHEAFLSLAKDEGRHASVFHGYTKTALHPKKARARIIACLHRLLSREKLYRIIADGEYSAEKAYAKLIADFPDIESVKADEKRHGDTVLGLLS